MNVLMIDNYDSFTYNLVHYLESNPYNVGIVVVQPHELNLDLIDEHNIIGVIVSPGPSHPKDRPEVIEFVKQIYEKLPIFGICFGHQLLWHMTGGVVERGERPIHGATYDVMHDGKFIYKNIPNPVVSTRYHSLVCTGENKEFEVVGKTDDGVCMAIRHKNLPLFGVQYHPESILSEYGHEQLYNFIEIALEEKNESPR